MGLILDTSAVIGWVELQSESVVAQLREAAGQDVPVIHAVTLGELARGVAAAPDDETRDWRAVTLEFARTELEVVALRGDGAQPALFGVVANAVSRKISHNDCWITAAAIAEGHDLVTQDRRLADQLTNSIDTGALGRWLDRGERSLHVQHCERRATRA